MHYCKAACCKQSDAESYVTVDEHVIKSSEAGEVIQAKSAFEDCAPKVEQNAQASCPPTIKGIQQTENKSEDPQVEPSSSDLSGASTTDSVDGQLKFTFSDLTLSFEGNGNPDYTVAFTERPIGLTFNMECPLRINSVNDAAKQKGVKVGSLISKINDQDVSTMTFEEAFQLIKDKADRLPLVQSVVKIEFEAGEGGKRVPILFTQKPIGVTIRGFPLSVSKCQEGLPAMQKTVKPGWNIIAINDQDVTKPPIANFDQAYEVFQKAVDKLPDAPAEPFKGNFSTFEKLTKAS